jgi:site-specific recombinase XerD
LQPIGFAAERSLPVLYAKSNCGNRVHNKRHPLEMAETEIGRFLLSLATGGRVSASTQNQALNALLFLYHEVLSKKIGLIDGVVRAKRPQRLPVVLTKDDVKRVLDRMSGASRLIENIQTPARNGDGSGCFRRPAITPTA